MLTIDRWHQALALRGPQRDPRAVPDRAEAIARHASALLAGALDACLPRHAGEVIRIRQLQVALAIDVARHPDEAAPAYAAALARHIVDAIDDGGPDVVCFADRIAYHAAFAVALAAGDAHARWVFDEFDGLASLPRAAALRTLFEERPAEAWPLLARLARETAVFAMLEGAEGLRVLDVLIAEAMVADAASAAPALPPPSVLACPAAAVLERLARAAASGCRLDEVLVAAALAGATVARPGTPWAASSSGASPTALEQRLRERSPAARAAARAATASATAASRLSQDEFALFEDTPCAAAGLVLLLDELGDWTRALPDALRSAFALAALAAAAPAEDAARLWHDACWRALFGVEAAFGLDELATLLGDTDAQAVFDAAAAFGVEAPRDDDAAALDTPLLHGLPAAWRALVTTAAQYAWRRVAWRVPGMAGASIGYLRRNLLGGDGSARRVDDDHWHWRVPRAPLHVLLAMTTLTAREHVWRGPPARLLMLEFHGS
ncbi:hypothetical protein [Sphaerotilus microaerophilus]|uniref:Uncharacterized protein n=1 Tax=Sphaerotilus microaerophilus TaxID=2914710 RepID=A0ABN6PL58_9BURK|nr:hypothetical protein [Sphaerotilus sp. FB-5]BDI05916.1 hypothetical protein CATMQ487_28860 [Sphaerotilus sp. FB-5]